MWFAIMQATAAGYRPAGTGALVSHHRPGRRVAAAAAPAAGSDLLRKEEDGLPSHRRGRESTGCCCLLGARLRRPAARKGGAWKTVPSTARDPSRIDRAEVDAFVFEEQIRQLGVCAIAYIDDLDDDTSDQYELLLNL